MILRVRGGGRFSRYDFGMEVGREVDEDEDIYRLCSMHAPAGIVVVLAEKL